MQIYGAKTKAEAMNLACRCLIFLFLLHPCVIKSSADSKCPKSFNCGNLGALEFPLADSVEPQCGIFTVNCTSSPPKIQFGAGGVWYNILQKLSANKFRVRDTLLYDRLTGRSCFSFGNQSLPYSSFSSFTMSPNLTFFSCTNSLQPDGHLVAVKILKESKGNGEEFVNEVASISRTSHVNIVSFLGFCFEGPKRALIYEFMPNGSLEKFIGKPSSSAEHRLGLEKLFHIAVGVAQGLDYLHSGCNTRILHFDIKPHNILLDKDLKPKISDFGLAKLCPNRSSIVSILDARGTVGYIAPEVFCRNFGEVSHKSDVYSYGMLVLEMVAGKKNIDPGADDQSSEIYFSDWIYKQLEVNSVMSLDSIENEDECQLARKMIIVGLWCIQTQPKNRPSISRVVEMLEGSLESLQIPPKPFLFSPPILAADASIFEPSKSQFTISCP